MIINVNAKNFIFVLIITFLLSTSWIIPVQAKNLSDIKKEKQNTQKKIDNIHNEQKEKKQELQSVSKQKQNLDNRHGNFVNQLSNLENQKIKYDQDLASIDESLKQSEKRLAHQEKLLKQRICVLYENSSVPYGDFLSIAAKSKNLTDLLARIEILNAIAHQDKQLMASVKSSKKDLEFKKSEKNKQVALAKNKINSKMFEINKIKNLQTATQRELDSLSCKIAQLEQQEDDLLSKSLEIENQIRLIQSTSSSGTKYSGGIMKWPIPSSSCISSPFGMRVHPILKKSKMHTGIDISASHGSSVIAAKKGIVILAGWNGGYGYAVVIDHGGGISTLYAHCSSILVSVGQVVNDGDTIAKVGSTGMSSGPHLHFEVRKNGTPEDPKKYLGG